MLVILLIPLVVFIVDARDVVGVALVCSTFVDNVDAINSVDTAVGTFFFFFIIGVLDGTVDIANTADVTVLIRVV